MAVKLPEGFYRCGFCHAEAPNGEHVCGDRYTDDAKRSQEMKRRVREEPQHDEPGEQQP